jgi:hypothetical protein
VNSFLGYIRLSRPHLTAQLVPTFLYPDHGCPNPNTLIDNTLLQRIVAE